MIYYVYILKSTKNNKFYIGQTGNIYKRFLRHNKGKVKSTKSGAPWKLVYSEEY